MALAWHRIGKSLFFPGHFVLSLETISEYPAKVSSHSSHEATVNPKGFFPHQEWYMEKPCVMALLNNMFDVGNKSVCLIYFQSEVVFIPRLYLTGSLLVVMHSCGQHVYDRRKVCGSVRSGQSH